MIDLVRPEGDKVTAKLIVVGEAPGRYEMMYRRPFVGPAGKHLDLLLNSAKISRTSCYITNVIPYMPTNLDKIIMLKAEKRSAGDYSIGEEFYLLRKALLDDLQDAKAKVVVAVGAVALFALTGKIGITKWRGSVLHNTELPGKLIVPIIHPAAALRMYEYTYSILYDLVRVNRIIENGFEFPKRNLIIRPSFQDCMEYMQKVHQGESPVAFDIETLRTRKEGELTDWEVSCISLSLSGDEAICIPFLDDHGDYFSEYQELEIWKGLRKILEDPNIPKLGQNLMFDASFLLHKHKIIVRNMHDTMIAQGVLLPDLPKGLDFLCSLYTNEPYYKDDGKQYDKFEGTPEAFWTYNAKDSAVLHEIYENQLEALTEQGNKETYNWLRRLMYPLMFMQERGILVDVEQVKKEAAKIDIKIAELQNLLNQVTGFNINPNSPKQVQTYFYITKDIKPVIRKGRPTVDEIALKRLSGKGFKEANLILEIRGLSKLKGTYLEMALDSDNRIRSRFDPTGTVTGRLSSRKTIFGTGGNMQNLPPAFKKLLLADPGHIMIDMDLSQAENRIVAYIAPEPRMMEAFELGLDVHSQTGSLISGLSVEEVKRQHAEGICPAIGKGTDTWRSIGKTANHSLNYGIGVNTFADRNELSRADAKLIKERYMAAYPGIRQYHAWVEDTIRRKDRTLVNLLGRHRKFLGRMDSKLFETGYAYIPQSTVADMINRWGIIPVYEQDKEFGGLILANQVHDSIVLTAKMDNIREAVRGLIKLKESLEQPLTWMSRKFNIPVECKVGINCGEMVKIDLKQHEDVVVESIEKAYGELTSNARNIAK